MLVLIGPPGSGKSPVVAEMQKLYRRQIAERAGAAVVGGEESAESRSGIGLDAATAQRIAAVLSVHEGPMLLEGPQDAGKPASARAAAKALGWELRAFGSDRKQSEQHD
jgi:MoxR-like ATPase